MGTNLKRGLVAILVAVLLAVSAPTLQAQNFTAQIQQFWNQLRTGALAFNTLHLVTGAYANWGATLGTNGYGIRDSAGTMQFKNSGGAWAGVSGAITGGACTNQAVTAIAAGTGAPTCTTLTSAYVDTTIAKTGTDINTSNQVTATHLAAALPVNQGGSGFTSYTIGDFLYADSSSTLAKRAAVAVGQVLASAGTGTAPAYTATPSVTSITAKGGAGTGTFKAEGVICDTTAGTCSCSAYVSSNVLNQWNAITCTVPASTLAALGDELNITADFLASANANNKDIQLVWNGSTCGGGTSASMCSGGGTLLASATTATNANSVTATGKIIRTGSSTQTTFGVLRASTAFLAQSAAAASATDTGTIIIAVGCRNTSAGAACSDAPTPQLTIRYSPQ